MAEQRIELKTADGTCPCTTYTAPGDRPAPAVILFMDGIGIRPALRAMAERIASNGFFVMLPNLYYRSGETPVLDAATTMRDPSQRDRMMQMIRTVTPAGTMSDTRACLDHLDGEPRVKGSRVGCVGYCMGGAIALRTAATFPDRVAAAASIHGASLATDQPDSPHRLLAKVRGAVYVAVAGIDPWLQPGETDRLREALVAAGTRHEVEEYPGATHGFAAPDAPVHDRGADERHWEQILKLFRSELG